MMEIIPKSPQSASFAKQVLSVAAIGVFAVAVGGFLLLFFLESRAANNLEELQLLLGAEKTEAQAELEQDVFASRSRLQDFANLVQLRKDMLSVFLFLETVVHPQITFLSMNIDPARQSVQLRGEAPSFLALDEQVALLQAREEPSSLSLTSLELAQNGGVAFQMELQFPLTFFK